MPIIYYKIMRTSPSQFKLLVEFMERHGDLSKPTEGPLGRITNIQRWAELTEILNADATGDGKTAEKWRKVWSDFKNNTKKKVARIHRTSLETGGYARISKLTDLEQKVLNIVQIAAHTATGMVHSPQIGSEECRTPDMHSSLLAVYELYSEQEFEQEVVTGPSSPEVNSNISFIEINDEDDTNNAMEDLNRPGSSPCFSTLPPSHEVPSQSGETGWARAAETPPSPWFIKPYTSRRKTRTQPDLARQAFVKSDCNWRAFRRKQEEERIKIRLLELKSEERWQDLFKQFLVLGNRIVDVLERKNSDIIDNCN